MVICGFSTFVNVTDKSEQEAISKILTDEVGESLNNVSEDNSRHRDSEILLEYR